MAEALEIQVPRDTVNDDVVTVVEWHVAAGEWVTAGRLLVSIETSKATVEVEAKGEGFLEIAAPAGAEVAIGAVVGQLLPERPAPAPALAPTGQVEAVVSSGGSANAGVRISQRAQKLIDEHGLDATVFASQGLVRERQVQAWLESNAGAAQAAQPEEAAVKTEAAEQRQARDSAYVAKGPFDDAQRSAGLRGRGLVWLGLNYLFRTWLLGGLVRWTPRGLLIPLHRLRGVKIGRDCFIDPSAVIETAHPGNITIGNDVRIAAHAVVMTHIRPSHHLMESGLMAEQRRPVVLEDHSFIGVNAVIMPGVTVGRAAVVASGAVVMGDVEPYTLVMGNPAKPTKRFGRP